MAQAQATVLTEINGLYVTLFGLPATQAGITYWENQVSNFDHSVTQSNAGSTAISLNDQVYLGQQMTANSPVVGSPPTTYFQARYPATMTDQAYVQALYQNMSGFIGTAAGDNYWFNLLQATEGANPTAAQITAAREAIVGQFTHDFLSNDLTVGAVALGVSASDYALLVASQQTLLNKVEVSQAWANETTLVPASILNYTTTTSTTFAAAQALMLNITSNSSSVTGADAAIVQADATTPASLAPITTFASTPPVGTTFTLTTAVDNIVGAPGSDTFNGTYSDGGIGGGNTFQIGDTLAGGGGANNTLNITPTIAISGGAAATSLVDALWADITGIQNVNVTTGAGAINITTGTNFNHAFATGGVDLTTTSTGGAINIDMGTVPFTGAATLITTSTGGAQTIVTGSGPAAVTASSGAGAITVSGSDLLSVSATTTGAGAQTY